MNNMLNIALINLGAVTLLQVFGWLISLRRKNVTIADSLWGAGFVLIAWLTFLQADGFEGRKILIAAAVTIWGLRLFIHITRRGIGKGEDPRYGDWRKRFGARFPLVSLFRVFLIQALFMWLISLSLQAAQMAPLPDRFTVFDIAGMLIWLAGITIEASADYQLSRFLSDPANKGRVMRYRLWKYSRHPNYFGESMIWWGIYLVSCSVPYGFFTVISPILITYTLLKLTGVTLMEETIFKGNAEYEEYRRVTSSFIPWFPKKPSETS